MTNRGRYGVRLEPKTLRITTDGTIITRKGQDTKHHFTEITVELNYDHNGNEIRRDISMDELVDGYLKHLNQQETAA